MSTLSILLCFQMMVSNNNPLISEIDTAVSLSESSEQLSTLEHFINTLRTYDLNDENQLNYTLTESEYSHLKYLWDNLTVENRVSLISGDGGKFWRNTLCFKVFYDLNNGKTWQAHLSGMVAYKAEGISISLSCFDEYVSIFNARNLLCDQLFQGKPLFENGVLTIPDNLKKHVIERAGKEAVKRFNGWVELINTNQVKRSSDKIRIVDDFFNNIILQQNDKKFSTQTDYWQSPIETLARGTGDCEDFAIAKYVSLRMLGIPKEQLLIMVLELPDYENLHAVLCYYPEHDDDPWILDNLKFNHLKMKAHFILRLSFRKRFQNIKPIWGINENVFIKFGKKNEVSPNPDQKCTKFGIAMINSQRLLSSLVN